MGDKVNAYGILVVKPEGRPRFMWEDTIKMDLRGIGWGGMDWVDMAVSRDQWGTQEQGNETSSSIKCWEILE
jgi:hypothetical protein